MLLAAVGMLLGLGSYSPLDPSLNVASSLDQPRNWMGIPGAYFADVALQSLGLASFALPLALAWSGIRTLRRTRSDRLVWTMAGASLLLVVLCCALQLAWAPLGRALPDRWDSTIYPGGTVGLVLTRMALGTLNFGGALLALVAVAAVGGFIVAGGRVVEHPADAEEKPSKPEPEAASRTITGTWQLDTDKTLAERPAVLTPPANSTPKPPPVVPPAHRLKPNERDGTVLGAAGGPPRAGVRAPLRERRASRGANPTYPLPAKALLKHVPPTLAYDAQELQATGQRIVAKFEEFGVRGDVSQINPGPVVTTFEYKPDRGIKLTKIVGLSEDMCMALKVESILMERIPGKSTVGIEVPNRKRELISFRETAESRAFDESKSMLTFALGKDINGKIHCADLASMPHLLVAGQTGSGKSVMVNALIMSLLLRATPKDVRLILIDPKTVELTFYRDIPHLLTPVITDMKEATHALINATREMERRLQLLAKHGARNISQFNAIVERQPIGTVGDGEDQLEPLPYIVVVVDELADLMMLAGRKVEEAIQRLAQMSRAVGIHLLLATQRPSVDVITGLIKANIPARLSFLVATRVDSRTILDSMGAESLLGKGDMLFLPPGTARMKRLHGPLVTEDEITKVVSHWKSQAAPDYETDFLREPAGEKRPSDASAADGAVDALYDDAVKLVMEMGKASTSTLQRRLRIGYGRAARILDAMEAAGIIGPPDGSKPRKVLRPAG